VSISASALHQFQLWSLVVEELFYTSMIQALQYLAQDDQHYYIVRVASLSSLIQINTSTFALHAGQRR
jgi:hypothetical protein